MTDLNVAAYVFCDYNLAIIFLFAVFVRCKQGSLHHYMLAVASLILVLVMMLPHRFTVI